MAAISTSSEESLGYFFFFTVYMAFSVVSAILFGDVWKCVSIGIY